MDTYNIRMQHCLNIFISCACVSNMDCRRYFTTNLLVYCVIYFKPLCTSLIHSTSHVIAYYLLFNTMYNYGIHTTTNVFCIPTQLYHITYHLVFHTWRLHGEHIHNKRKHKLVHKCIVV